MYTTYIYMKSGHRIGISDEIANILNDRIVRGVAKDWQFFIDDQSKKMLLAIKLSEIDFIASPLHFPISHKDDKS